MASSDLVRRAGDNGVDDASDEDASWKSPEAKGSTRSDEDGLRPVSELCFQRENLKSTLLNKTV